jgi:hypothetical protein
MNFFVNRECVNPTPNASSGTSNLRKRSRLNDSANGSMGGNNTYALELITILNLGDQSLNRHRKQSNLVRISRGQVRSRSPHLLRTDKTAARSPKARAKAVEVAEG